jgi:hypothetical protein
MLLHSGYHSVPRRHMIWQQKADCYNALVADNIRRKEVDTVLACLHFRDNTKIDDDGYYKVRYIILSKKYEKFSLLQDPNPHLFYFPYPDPQ